MRRLLSGALLVFTVSCVVFAAWSWWLTSRPQYVSEAPVTALVSPSAIVAETPRPSVVASEPMIAPPAPKLMDPRGLPVSMTITHADTTEPYVMMNFAPRAGDPRDFVSECGKVAWWDMSDTALPGALSPYMSLITGHVTCGAEWYSIANITNQLEKAGDSGRAGDILRVAYDSGDVVVATARSDVAVVKKAELNTMPETTKNVSPARVIRVSTCDRSLPLRGNGHSDYSAYMLFYRVQ